MFCPVTVSQISTSSVELPTAIYLPSGDQAKACTAYQDFLALWKDADTDVPILKEAKAEYGKLP